MLTTNPLEQSPQLKASPIGDPLSSRIPRVGA